MWKPKNDEKLNCHKYHHHEASMYDNHAIELYKQEKYSKLVGYVPIECSNLVKFLNTDKQNRLTAIVTGKIKQELGLKVPEEWRNDI